MAAAAARICCFLTILSLMALVVSTRPFSPTINGLSFNNPGTKLVPKSQLSLRENIGSEPPKCEDKCYGCKPCEAIQVPTTNNNNNSHVGIQYTNYEPEGWKCKCGHTFFSP